MQAVLCWRRRAEGWAVATAHFQPRPRTFNRGPYPQQSLPTAVPHPPTPLPRADHFYKCLPADCDNTLRLERVKRRLKEQMDRG